MQSPPLSRPANEQGESDQPRQPHWSDAAYHWRHYGSPLRPCAADVRVMEALVRRAHAGHRGRGLRVLLLGVTPEIAQMAWPEGTQLLAVDRSPAMIEHVWPGDVAGRRKVVCGDWFDLANEANRFDVVIGDGTFSILGFPRQYRELAAVALRVLASGGVLIARYFLQAARREAPHAVIDDLVAHRIASFDAFKLRLAMAMQERAEEGVRMGDVFAAWSAARIDCAALLAKTGWVTEVVETIRPWEGKDARLSFPRAAEMDAVLDEYFEREQEHRLDYELGERCPIASFRARRRAEGGA
jgi:SAM-dependent methyltransferase